MNDKNISKKQLPLKLALNMNRNKESVDSSFSTASYLKNAPIYNNAISNYFAKHVENDGPTVYDSENNSYTVTANGDVISASVPLFKVDLKKFNKEETQTLRDVEAYDKTADDELIVTRNASYLNINFNGVETSQDISGATTVLAIKGKITDLHEAVVSVLFVSSGNLTSAYNILVNANGSTRLPVQSVDWYNRGTWKQFNQLEISTASENYKDLEALYNNSIQQYKPLIQIVKVSNDSFGVSFLLKSGLVTDDDFIFSYQYLVPSENKTYTHSEIDFTFEEGEIITVTVDLKLQIALVAEGPFHYMDLQGANNKTYEIVPAGSYVKAYARSVTSVPYAFSVKINYSWPASTGGSSFVTGLGNLPLKYGRRKYDNGAYTVQGGDGKTNFNYANGLDYTDIFSALPAIAIDASSTTWNEAQTNRLEYDTQVAAINKFGNANQPLQQSLDGGNSHMITNRVGRNTSKPRITTVEITLGNSTQTVNYNSESSSFVYFDSYNDCDRDDRADYRIWFSNRQKYSDGTHNIYPNATLEQTLLSHDWPNYLSSGDMPKSHADDYNTDFGQTLAAWSNGQDRVYCPVWCYHRGLQSFNTIISIYTQVFSYFSMLHTATLYTTAASALANRFLQQSFSFQQQTGFAGDFNRHPAFLSSDGYLYNSDYRGFNSDEDDAYAIKAHITEIAHTGVRLTVHWVIDKSINLNPEETNKYHKGNTRFIEDGLFAQTIAFSHPSTPYPDDNPTNGQDWSDADKWYFVYYDSCLDKIVANPGVVAKECQVPYGAAFYTLNKYYHPTGFSVSKGDWNILYNVSTDGATLSGVSYSKGENRGTLLTPWFSVDKVLAYNATEFFYKSTDGKVYRVFIDDGYDIKIYFDRYIVINTISFENAYDMKTKQICHFADDWNGRLTFGRETSNVSFIETNNSLSLLLASAVGEQYTIDDSTLSSSILNPVPCSYWNGSDTVFTYKTNSEIDLNVYSSIGTSTYAQYLFSLNKMVRTVNSKFTGLTYPVSSNGTLYLNPDLFMRQLRSYTNADLFYEGDTAYAVVYYNNLPTSLYNLTSLQKNLSAVFIVQSQRYGVINDKIVSLTYSNNIITSVETVCDIKGLKYVGYLPAAAFFFSPKERKIYQFTGDADLTTLVECTEIKDILNTYYDTATKTLFWLTEQGFYCFSGDYAWFIAAENVDTFYTTNTDILIKYKDYDTTFLRLEPFEEYEKLPYEIETAFYGSNGNKISKLSCLYIQTLQDFVENTDYLRITAKSLTNSVYKDSHTEERERQHVISYIPEYDCGLGTSFILKGTIPIKQLVIDVNELQAAQKSIEKPKDIR